VYARRILQITFYDVTDFGVGSDTVEIKVAHFFLGQKLELSDRQRFTLCCCIQAVCIQIAQVSVGLSRIVPFDTRIISRRIALRYGRYTTTQVVLQQQVHVWVCDEIQLDVRVLQSHTPGE